MAEEYSLESTADMVIGELREFINIENQSVEKKHELHARFLALGEVMSHLADLMPEDMIQLHDPFNSVCNKLNEIREIIESYEPMELRRRFDSPQTERRIWKIRRVLFFTDL